RLETQPDALSQKEKRALEELLGKHLGKVGKAMTATMRLSMKPLTLADLSATQIAWVSNYLHYLKKEGGKNAIKLDALRKPNKSAQSYATFQTEILANVSNPSDKPKLYKNVGGRIMMALMPYASFSVNSKMELATNLGKLSDWGSMSNDERLQLSRNIGGNLTAIIAYQLIGQGIRNLMIYSAYQGFMALIANSGDLNDDEEKALEEVLTATRDDLITRNNE